MDKLREFIVLVYNYFRICVFVFDSSNFIEDEILQIGI